MTRFTTRSGTKLANDPDVKGAGLDITVKAGVVILRGRVHDDRAKEKASKTGQEREGRGQRHE